MRWESEHPFTSAKHQRSLRSRLGDHAKKIAGTQPLSRKKYECGYLAIREACINQSEFRIAEFCFRALGREAVSGDGIDDDRVPRGIRSSARSAHPADAWGN